MIKRLLNPILSAFLILGLLGPSVALCLPVTERLSCCPEPCSGHQPVSKNSACCQPAAEARPEPKISRAETAALAARPPVLLPSQALVLALEPAPAAPAADSAPRDASGLSPPLLA